MSFLTREGYVVELCNFEQYHREELTVTQEVSPFYNNKAQTFKVFYERDDCTVAVPRYWGIEHFGKPKALFGRTQENSNLTFRGELRSDIQQKAVDASLSQLSNHGGGVLSLCTGAGKTVMALYIACSLKLKTLVVVHKTFLLDQWEERIRTFVPFARVGRVQQAIEDVENCDIVVGMLQSIAMRKYDDTTFEDFGLIIFDEVHVVPAPVFSRVLLRLSAPHMLGLSATPVRRDGLSYVIHWFIGPTFFEHSLTGRHDVKVNVVNFKLGRILPNNMVAATSILCSMENRNNVITRHIVELVNEGRKIMLLSDRRAHCETLKRMLLAADTDSALYLGGMKGFELKKSEQKNVLLGTYSLAKEGLDIPTLDTIILASPRSDVVQACGRILHGKTEFCPLIVDIVDQWFIGIAQYQKRKTYYNKSGFTTQ
mmetsp:Transcript_7064/g.20682  ORF Transcript_7064/g.20682 Transcript_7064/m.20682 type:complete len:427 (+) Transcript_7064:1900-3180(+)